MNAGVTLAAGLPRDRMAWSRLAEASGNVFLTPEWIETWWRHLARGDEALTATGIDRVGSTQWLAVLAATRAGPLRALRFAGHGPADELGPICAAEARAAAGSALVSALRAQRPCDILVCEQVSADVDWESVLNASAIDRIPSPVVRFEHTTWDEFLASRTGSFRSQLRRDRRAAEEAGRYRVTLAAEPERVEAGMHALFAMHRERYRGRSTLVAEPAERFHADFARIAFERGWLRLWLLEIDGSIEAVWYGFRFAGSDAHYQSGRSRSCANGGGNLLVATAMRTALEDGMSEYRFLRGGEAYKQRWANGGLDLQTLVAGVTGPGRAAASVARTATGRGVRALPGKVARRLVLL
jgi:CelD/BcsL family acetyltransferase involved in cellulose biosynthesis